jgi:hypothetical protein
VTAQRAWRLRAPVSPALRRGLLAAIPVGAALLLDLEADIPVAGALSTGALLAGFVAFDSTDARTRFVWQMLSAPAIGAGAALGTLTSEPAVLAVFTMAAVASLAGLMVAVSPRLSIVGMTVVLALLIAQGLSLGRQDALDALLLGAAGAALQALLSVAISLLQPSHERVDLVGGTRRAVRAVRENLNLGSSSLRHALRWGTALGVGVAVYHIVDLGEHGYWVPLTVLFVLKPAPDQTIERIWMRAAGTVAGLVLATPLAILIGGLPIVEAATIAIAAALSFALLAIEYALFTTAITTFIVLLAHALGQAAWQAADERAVATLIGIAIAAVAVVAWGSRGTETRPVPKASPRPVRL